MLRGIFKHNHGPDQTERAIDLKFGMQTSFDQISGPTEAIFEIQPLGRDMGVPPGGLGGPKMAKNFFSIFQFFLFN